LEEASSSASLPRLRPPVRFEEDMLACGGELSDGQLSEVAIECGAVYNTSCLMCDVMFGGVFGRLSFLDALNHTDALKLKC
jgi:hypothetical protein